MPTKSFVTPGAQAPLQPDMASLAEERALLVKALLDKQGQTSAPLMDSGAFRTLNFDGLANALQARETQTALDNNRRKTLDVQGKYQQGLTESLQKFGRASRGSEVELPGPTPSGEPLTGRTPGNQEAFRDFLDSPYPEVQAAAERQQKEYDKRFEKAMDRSSLGSIQASGGSLAALAPKPDVKVSDGSAWDVSEGTPPKVVAGKWERTTLPDGTVVIRNSATGEEKSVDRSTKINMPGVAADKEFLESEAKTLSAQGDVLRRTGSKQLAALGRAEEASVSGAIQGPVANWVQFAQGLAQEFGLSSGQSAELLKNTETLNSDMGSFVLASIKALGTNPSNADREYAAQTAGGQKLSPEGLKAVIRAGKADLINSYVIHNQHADALATKFPSASVAKVTTPPIWLGNEAGASNPKLPLGIVKLPGYERGEDGLLYRQSKPNAAPTAAAPAQGKIDPNSAESKAKLKAMGFRE